MSAFLDKAEAIATRLEADSDLDSVEILVERQKDIASQFSSAMGKVKGGVIIILFNGYETYEEDVEESLLISSYSVSIWTKPILRDGITPADDLVASVHKSLHGWKHDNFCGNNAMVKRGRLLPNDRFLIHELEVSIKHQI